MRSMWPRTSCSSSADDTSALSGSNRLDASEFIASIVPRLICPFITAVAPTVRINSGASDAIAPRTASTTAAIRTRRIVTFSWSV